MCRLPVHHYRSVTNRLNNNAHGSGLWDEDRRLAHYSTEISSSEACHLMGTVVVAVGARNRCKAKWFPRIIRLYRNGIVFIQTVRPQRL